MALTNYNKSPVPIIESAFTIKPPAVRSARFGIYLAGLRITTQPDAERVLEYAQVGALADRMAQVPGLGDQERWEFTTYATMFGALAVQHGYVPDGAPLAQATEPAPVLPVRKRFISRAVNCLPVMALAFGARWQR